MGDERKNPTRRLPSECRVRVRAREIRNETSTINELEDAEGGKGFRVFLRFPSRSVPARVRSGCAAHILNAAQTLSANPDGRHQRARTEWANAGRPAWDSPTPTRPTSAVEAASADTEPATRVMRARRDLVSSRAGRRSQAEGRLPGRRRQREKHPGRRSGPVWLKPWCTSARWLPSKRIRKFVR